MNSDNDQSVKRSRSPGYPVISLGKAIEATRKMWDAQRKQEAHIDSVLQTLGYTRHGGSLRIIAALNHFGLVDESGAKDARKIRLSDSAQDILHLQESDPRRQKALKAAALLPLIHAALWERYGAHLPDDGVIRPFLIRDKGYSDDVAADVIQNYRSSFELAKLDKLDDDAEKGSAPGTKLPESGAKSESTRTDDQARKFEDTSRNSMATTEQELPILVGQNRVARIPFPMTSDDFELLMGTLNLWKKRIVQDVHPGMFTLFGFPNATPHSPAAQARSLMSFPVQATWKNKDHDQPVTITGTMGERDGVTYYQTSTGTGIPGNELTFA